MYLTYRPGVVADIDACMEMLPPDVFCDPALDGALPGLWRAWLRDEEMQLTILEDEERASGDRRLAFGASMFVTDEFVRETETSIVPPIAGAIVLQSLRGKRRQLSLQQIRKANSGDGLNLLVLVIGWSRSIVDPDDLRRVKAKLVEAYFYTHAGYKIKLTMQEVYSSSEMERALAIGAFLRTDYAHLYGDHPPPGASRPYLVGVTRDQVKEGSYLWPLFLYSKPRFGFTGGEQSVLKLALIDQTDAEIADALCISLSSVHKRWQSIFDRAMAADARWLPVHERSQPCGNSRGVEKRRHLLSYVRDHPEELRPIVPPDAAVPRECSH